MNGKLGTGCFVKLSPSLPMAYDERLVVWFMLSGSPRLLISLQVASKGKRWELSVELLQDCKQWATPNIISYSASITGCEKGVQ